MTDNEIIKALECCLICEDVFACETQCPFYVKCKSGEVLEHYVVSLINRQKAEIDGLKIANGKMYEAGKEQEAEIAELQHRNSELDIELKAMRGAANSYKAKVERLQKYDEERDIRLHARLTAKARADAIKEFAERLQSKLAGNTNLSALAFQAAIYDMHNLVKEMVGGDE